MDANFNTLLNLYIEDQATPEQVAELMRLIRDGAYQYQHKPLVEQSFDAVYKEPFKDIRKRREQRQDKLNIVRRLFPKSARFKIVPIAALLVVIAASLTILITIGLYLYDAPAAGPDHRIGNIYKGKGFYILPDSSTVLLNDDSQLTYTVGKDRREVTLVGEGYFTVHHDPRRAFYVRTGKVLTKVLGTSFSVRAYPAEHDFMVAVTEGSVRVSDDAEDYTYGVVNPNQQLAVNPKTDAVLKTAGTNPPALEWRKDFLILNDITLKDAAALIHARYNATLVFKNPALDSCQVNAKFLSDEKLTTVLEVITSALNLHYTIEDGKVIIDGVGCE